MTSPDRGGFPESGGDRTVGRRLPALDGIRAIAVGIVVFYHGGFAEIPGDLGVQLFFVLSGFLITRLLIAEIDRTGTVSYRDFVERRAFRILPAYYALLAGSFVLDHLLGGAWSLGMEISSLTYLYNYWAAAHGAPTTSISHTWSLAVEEHFYVLWPAAFVIVARMGRRTLTSFCAWSIGIVLVWRCYLWWKLGSPAVVYNRSDTRIDSILVGCLLACLWHSRALQLIERWSAPPWTPLITVIGLTYIRKGLSPGFHYSIGFSLEALFCALLIFQLMALSNSRLWRWIDSTPARWVGALSYSIYLWHIWGISIGAHLPDIPAVRFVGGLAVTLVLASFSYYLIERPALAIRARRAEAAEANRVRTPEI